MQILTEFLVLFLVQRGTRDFREKRCSDCTSNSCVFLRVERLKDRIPVCSSDFFPFAKRADGLWGHHPAFCLVDTGFFSEGKPVGA